MNPTENTLSWCPWLSGAMTIYCVQKSSGNEGSREPAQKQLSSSCHATSSFFSFLGQSGVLVSWQFHRVVGARNNASCHANCATVCRRSTSSAPLKGGVRGSQPSITRPNNIPVRKIAAFRDFCHTHVLFRTKQCIQSVTFYMKLPNSVLSCLF